VSASRRDAVSPRAAAKPTRTCDPSSASRQPARGDRRPQAARPSSELLASGSSPSCTRPELPLRLAAVGRPPAAARAARLEICDAGLEILRDSPPHALAGDRALPLVVCDHLPTARTSACRSCARSRSRSPFCIGSATAAAGQTLLRRANAAVPLIAISHSLLRANGTLAPPKAGYPFGAGRSTPMAPPDVSHLGSTTGRPEGLHRVRWSHRRRLGAQRSPRRGGAVESGWKRLSHAAQA
jgi:hypothetical protein